MNCSKTVLLQPLVPHYRTEFFNLLDKQLNGVDIFTLDKVENAESAGFNIEKESNNIGKCKLGPFLWYNPFKLSLRKRKYAVLMWNPLHLTTWLLLLTKWIHRTKIILWGQGISVKRYLKEEKKPDWKLKWMLRFADGAWIYMDKEYEQWHSLFPKKLMVALQNSLTGVDEMISYKSDLAKSQLKQKYNISQKRIFIFSARFSHNYRRTDLLEEIIQKLDKKTNGFIIIGDGPFKPDFSKYENVYDFGALYDTAIKRELFFLADLYLQPGWVGLSIVEAMAYGKPICTFERSEETLQCVEYSYIKDGWNGIIFKDIEDSVSRLNSLSDNLIKEMSSNAKETAKQSSPNNMVKRAVAILK